MASIKSSYTTIDIHAGHGWPETVPVMSEKDAINALRRLWRWATGRTIEADIVISSGRRSACLAPWYSRTNKGWQLNPSKGWQEFVHDLSHAADYFVNGSGGHSKHHARFERNMIKQVIARGWLEHKPEAPAKVVQINNTEAKQRLALERIEVRIVNWQRKQKRAENALKKLAKQQRYYVKALNK